MAELVGRGKLRSGESKTYEVDLKGGITYRIYVVPEDDDDDFDLIVRDSNGENVSTDTSGFANAECKVAPDWDAEYQVRVKSSKGKGNYELFMEEAGYHDESLDPVQRLAELQPRVQLNTITGEIQDLEDNLRQLEDDVRDLRQKGYIYDNVFEPDIEEGLEQLPGLRKRVEAEQPSLRSEARRVERQVARDRDAADAVTRLENKVEAVESRLRDAYSALRSKVSEHMQRVRHLKEVMKHVSEASFDFMGNEHVVEALGARWEPEHSDEVEGVLYLTDSRLIFETKYEKKVKKMLIFTAEVQKIQEFEWDIPVMQIEKAEGTTRGFLGKDDYLIITGNRDARIREAEIHLLGMKGDVWVEAIDKVKTRQIDREMVGVEDEDAPPVPPPATDNRDIPTACPSCGATFGQTILRGQTEITCEYCGAVTRI